MPPEIPTRPPPGNRRPKALGVYIPPLPAPQQPQVTTLPSPAQEPQGPASEHAAVKVQIRDWKGFATFVVAVASIGLGVSNKVEKAPQPRVDSQDSRISELKQSNQETRDRLELLERYARELREVADCLREQQSDLNEQLTPPVDRMAGKRRLRPWEDRCRALPRAP